ncbi:MAG: transglycosylase domain-containing protein [Bacteroidales bacterium]|nr:transglycosylase domain-containing protein [Bacteroidales bacterium]
MKTTGLYFCLATAGCLMITISLTARGKTEKMVAEALASEQCTLDIAGISQERIAMLLSVEDPNFYQHKGVDFKTPGAGYTTISQGLVKLFYFKKFKPGIAKIRQTFIARYRFDSRVSKHDQLWLFFNYAYLGNDDSGAEIRGFDEASGYYFKTDFFSLTRDEYLALVAMLINPNQFRPDKFPEKNAERVSRIRELLAGNCVPTDFRDCCFENCK